MYNVQQLLCYKTKYFYLINTEITVIEHLNKIISS